MSVPIKQEEQLANVVLKFGGLDKNVKCIFFLNLILKKSYFQTKFLFACFKVGYPENS